MPQKSSAADSVSYMLVGFEAANESALVSLVLLLLGRMRMSEALIYEPGGGRSGTRVWRLQTAGRTFVKTEKLLKEALKLLFREDAEKLLIRRRVRNEITGRDAVGKRSLS